MRIALDAQPLFDPQDPLGPPLLETYQRLAELHPNWRVLGLHRQAGPRPDLPEAFFEPCLVGATPDRFDAWSRFLLPREAWRRQADVLHCARGVLPAWTSTPVIASINHLPTEASGSGEPDHGNTFAEPLRSVCRRADWITCPSHHVRDRLVKRFGADPDRITTLISVPRRHSFEPIDRDRWAPVLESYGLQRPFVLHIGGVGGPFNTRRLIEAWDLLETSLQRTWRLLVLVDDQRTQRELQSAADETGAASGIVISRRLDPQDMPVLLAAADVLAAPSLTEPDSQTILDAWRAGAAVLSSGGDELVGVTGDAAVNVKPNETETIAAGLTRLLLDRRLRSQLIRRGRVRLNHYSRPAAIERFAQVMRRLVVDHRRAAAA